MFHSYFERKNDKVLTFNTVNFPNFEISASLMVEQILLSSQVKRSVIITNGLVYTSCLTSCQRT